MRRRRYTAAIAEYALSEARPLHGAMAAAAAIVPDARRAESEARAGNLGVALSFAHVDRLVADAALLEPKATLDVSRATRRVPARAAMLLPAVEMSAYLSAVLTFEGLIAVILSQKVLPVFAYHFAGQSADPSLLVAIAAIAIAAVLVLWAGLVLGVQLRWAGEGGVAVKLLESLPASRLLAAAAALDRHGIAPPRALASLAGSAGVGSASLERLTGAGRLDGAACAELSAFLVERSRLRAGRLTTGIKVAGTFLVAMIAFAILASVFLTLARVEAHIGGAP